MSRAALIGTGFWAAKLAEAVGTSELELACCYSRDEAGRAEFAERFGCEAAPSYEAALGSVDAVLLATPNDLHAEQALAAAARDVHVFVGKPIAGTLAAGERMREARERAGVTLLVGHELRRLGAARKTRGLDDVGVATLELASGALGVIASSYVSPKTYSLRLFRTEAVLDYRTDISVWPAADRLDEMTTLTLGERG